MPQSTPPRSGKKAESAAKTDSPRVRASSRTQPSQSTLPPTSPMQDLAAVAASTMPTWSIDPTRMLTLQTEYMTRLQALWTEMSGAQTGAMPQLQDKRFSAPAWHQQSPLAWNAALYLLNSDFLQRMADSVEADPKTQERIRFFTRQWVDAVSPSNFLPTNPEVQQRLIETQGESLVKGMQNMLADLGRGTLSITDDQAFEVGRNVGTSKGAVVFRNDVIELIQYSPSTPTVASRPLLMVPPFINKFYILDLQPDNSLVAHAVSNGNTVFMVSWVNPGAEHASLTWDDYVQRGVIDAIEAVRSISGADTINTLGFCVGGTILACALAVLAGRGERPVESMTLMTSLLDFQEPGSLGVFIDPMQVAWREQTLGNSGLMTAKDLGATFSFLRPNDLVWNYFVSNYLKGESPPAFDLLYWNSDGTNLPGPLYIWYLRHMYLQNELKVPGAIECLGVPVDLSRIDVPTYVFGAKEDHIVLWTAAYASTQILSNQVRFVLGASGHIAGSINSAVRNKRSYWVQAQPGSAYPASAQAWLDGASELKGSWWTDWSAWLEAHQGTMQSAPTRLGDADHPMLENSPGSYVKVKSAAN